MRNWLLWMALLPATGTAADPFVVGACTHFGQGKGLLKVNLSMMRQAGISSFRDEVGWRAIERTKGQYEMPPAWDEFEHKGPAGSAAGRGGVGKGGAKAGVRAAAHPGLRQPALRKRRQAALRGSH